MVALENQEKEMFPAELALRRSGRIYVFQREHTTIVKLLSDGKMTPAHFWTAATMKTAVRLSALIGLIFAVIFVAVWRFYPNMPGF